MRFDKRVDRARAIPVAVNPPSRPGCRKTYLAAFVSLLAALALAACGGGDDDGGGNGGGGDSAAGESRPLTVSIGAEPGDLDPLLSQDGQTSTFQFSVYEGLTARDGDEIVPALATDWELDGKTWRFKLRDGVTFHNGEPLEAEDVVASWKRALSEGSENLGSFVLEDTKITAVDDSTVEIARPVADPTTPARAAAIVIAPAELADPSNDEMRTKMVGTGPYEQDSWDRGSTIELSAYPDYWGDAPSIPSVTLTFAEEEAVRLAELQAGEADMALNMPPDLATDEFEVVATPISEVGTLRLNAEDGPFTDPRVREAASLAIDRQQLMDELYGGHAKPAKGQIVADYVFGSNPELEDVPFDPDRARQLLEEAGATGAEIQLVGSRGRWPSDTQVGQAVAKMLEEVGFTVDLVQPPFNTWLDAYFEQDATAAPDAMLLNHSNQLFDSSYSIGQLLLCDGAASTTCDKRIDKEAEAGLAETDVDAREGIYHDLWRYVGDEHYTAPIAEVLKVNFVTPELNWTPEVDGFLRFQGMSID